MERAVDDRRDEPLGIVLDERVLEHALAGAGLAHDDAEASLLAVHAQRLEHHRLMRQERDLVERERVLRDAEVRADHGVTSDLRGRGLRSLAMRSTGLASPMRSLL